MLPVSPANLVKVEVVLPLAISKLYTYYVPEEWVSRIQFGVRVEVVFGKNKIYAAIVVNAIKDHEQVSRQVKPILEVLDDEPIITETQYKLWQWMSDYYCCTIV